MQSGISASTELHEAFSSFVEDTTLFCLPVTISNEQLVPQPPVPFATTANADDDDANFFASLPSLSSSSREILQPKTPIYLLLRRHRAHHHSHSDPSDSSAPDSGPTAGLVALTYVPSDSPVRAKTLFASTRATVVRELGSEKFADTVFAVDAEDVLEESAWREREGDHHRARGRAAEGAAEDDEDVEALTQHERELRELRQAEIEAKNVGMARRADTGIGGSFGGGNGGVGGGGGSETPLRLEDGLVDALLEMQQEEGRVVVLTINVETETFVVASKQSNVSPADVPGLISDSKPQYTFYRYPAPSSPLLFIYTCPLGASIKERMLNASSRIGILKLAQSKGVTITHKIEASGPDEITKERLDEEVNPPKAEAAPTRGFARPKRPGR